ncbi:MAG: SDR family oxidoreductase [Paracoccaceae bacterium]
MTKILFLGATGMIGSVVARGLAEAGRDVTALVRDPDAARAKLPEGLPTVRGDVGAPATLEPVGEAEVVIFMLSVDPKSGRPGAFNPDRDGLRNVVQAAKAGERPHVVYLASQLERTSPHPWWVLQAKAEASAMLKASGLDHTILRPSNVMESLPGRMLRGRSVGWIGRPKQRSWWIAGADLARMVNAHLGRPLDRSYDLVLQGPEGLTVRAAAERFAAARGLKSGGAPLPVLSLIGRLNREIGYAAQVSRAMNDAPERLAGEAEWAELGRPRLTVEGFARSLPA